MATPNDGTSLGTGEVISNEFVSPNQPGVRRDSEVPATAYKLPRSKIAIGPYGQDWGDADYDTPLQVHDRLLRRINQDSLLADREATGISYARNYAERVASADMRGRHLDTRGVR